MTNERIRGGHVLKPTLFVSGLAKKNKKIKKLLFASVLVQFI